MNTAQQKLSTIGSKRILSLDGGGMRGALTLGFLKRIEENLAKENGQAVLLGNYFDLIGGTSTGAIIATALAIGMTVDEIKMQYFAMGDKIFGEKFSIFELRKRLKATYDATNLESALAKFFGDRTFSDDSILCGLCVVAKRADTNSTWPLMNFGKYYKYTKDYKLRDVVRASAAAPSYFLPQQIQVTPQGQKGCFVDGGVSMSNNPTLELFKMATIDSFGLNWETGADKMHITSIGTGSGVFKEMPQKISKNNLLEWAKSLPDMFMQDASWQVQTMMQWIATCENPWLIDREIGNLKNSFLGKEPLCRYKRLNVMLEQEKWFTLSDGTIYETRNLTHYGYSHLSEKEIGELQEMDNAKSVELLFEIGYKAAKEQVG
ncbi:MAG: patatin-like phospholipase family protein [Bacteroidetes bacterium]|nr:patatin-like phospholipase family protein [Bacteroidota bacterium]MBP6314563.1 patatin-like phospholipase family protein [Chitinophagaceae bacterium]